MDFDRPAGTTPVSQSPFCHAVAPCGRSPTFVKFSVLPALIRTRLGTKLYSTLLPPILIVSTPVAIGPTGQAILFVLPSIAVNVPLIWAPIGAACVPPT